MLRADAIAKVFGPHAKAFGRKLAKGAKIDPEELALKNSVIALQPVSFVVEPGQALAIMGPPGSGKSTLLRILAGTEQPTIGGLWLGRKKLSDLGEGGRLSLRRKRIRFVASNDRLFPHLTLKENLLLAARISSRRSAPQRVSALFKKLGLQGCEEKFPGELTASQSRVALLAQALTGEPEVLLLDGIVDGLPAADREQMFELLARLRKELNLVLVLSTEDAAIAFAAGDILTMLGGGKVLRTGATLDVILEPGSDEVKSQISGFELGDVIQVRDLMQSAPTIRLGTAVTESSVEAIVDGGHRYAAVIDEELKFQGLVTPEGLRRAMGLGGNLREELVKPKTINGTEKVRAARRTLLEQDHALAVTDSAGIYQGLIDRADIVRLP